MRRLQEKVMCRGYDEGSRSNHPLLGNYYLCTNRRARHKLSPGLLPKEHESSDDGRSVQLALRGGWRIGISGLSRPLNLLGAMDAF